MAKDSSAELSDKTLVSDTVGINDACTIWKNTVLSENLSSIDVSSAFSPLVENGIATSYVESLKTALESSEKVILNLINLLSEAAENQDSVDKNERDKVGTRTYGGGSGGSGRRTSSDANVDTNQYDVKDVDGKTEIYKEFADYVTKLDDDSKLALLTSLNTILGDNTYNYLYKEKYGEELKKQLLASPNIDAELKTLIKNLDENEVQVLLQNLLTGSNEITEFSNIIMSTFDKQFQQEYESASYTCSESISNLYSAIAKQDNVQNYIKELYFGNVTGIDKSAVSFTKVLVDTLSEQTGISCDELLNDSRYNDPLKDVAKDLAKSYTFLNIQKNIKSAK